MKFRYILFLFSLTFLIACQPKITEFAADKGQADFTTYVAIGNSLTAGYADNALSRDGQMYSFPNMLAEQFKTVGLIGEFKQPLMPAGAGVGVGATLSPKLVLGLATDCKDVTSLGPVSGDPNATQGELYTTLMTPVGADGPYQNLGVPGAKVAHLLFDGYGNPAAVDGDDNALYNPYYVRFAPSTSTSVVATAVGQSPTFFTSWIGNNDILGYATTGGASPASTLTDPTLFAGYMNAILDAMTASGTKGAIANIPDVTSVPFFTTVPYYALVLTDETQVSALNAAYAELNAVRASLSLDPLVFALGPNALVIADAAAPGGLRQIKPTELVLLSIPQDNLKCAGWGSSVPIPDQYILTETELAAISTATTAFNATIAGLAETYDLALVDMNTHLKSFTSGLMFDGIGFTTTFVTGGAFSLDGVHLNPRGYSIVANFFIDAINTKYNSSVPKVNVVDYPAVIFP